MFSKKELLLDSLVINIWNYQEKNNTYDFWDEQSNNNDIVQQLVGVINNNLKTLREYFIEEKNSLLDTEELDVLEQEQLEEIKRILTMLSQYEAMEDQEKNLMNKSVNNIKKY